MTNRPPEDEPVKSQKGFRLLSALMVVLSRTLLRVSGSDTVEVKLKDGRTFEGKVVGIDPVTDVAAKKINASNAERAVGKLFDVAARAGDRH
jgi:small nuclear ribonucleoprotein (snRNP)-like protein